MNILIWNYRRLENPRKVQVLQDIIRQKDPKLVFLCETKCDVSILKGTGILWADEINLRILSSSECYIDTEVGDIGDKSQWRFMGFYRHLTTVVRSKSWEIMRRLVATCSIPWLIEGDFNELLGSHEKEKRPPRSVNQILEFRMTDSDCHLHDLGLNGIPYTWITTKVGGIKEHLNWALVIREWKEVFNKMKATHLDPSKSNHADHVECEEIIKEAWNSPVVGVPMYQVRMDQLLEQEEKYWRQRSRAFLIKARDRNM
ncbi:hypothetical protein ACFX2J_014727 [Malus domestica]